VVVGNPYRLVSSAMVKITHLTAIAGTGINSWIAIGFKNSGVQVTVDDCVRERFNLTITIRVKSDQFVAEDVKRTVASALTNHFSLQNRKLGEHLYLSEVYKVVENIQGVENSICVLNNADTPQLVKATNDSMVVYLDTETGSALEVKHEEYQP